jgi:hypothetical protein
MLDPQYSVFISATQDDLLDFRLAVRDAALSVGIRPVMMEYFSASGDPPLAKCLSRVSECDLTVVVVGRRYGWVPAASSSGSDDRSITWLECERTVSEGKDLLAFLLDKHASWPIEKTEPYRLAAAVNDGTFTPELPQLVQRNIEQLSKFRDWLETGRTRSTFTTADDLRSKVTLALYEWREKQRGSRQAVDVKHLAALNGVALDGYKLFQGLPLNRYSNGIDGLILILLDERIAGLPAELRHDGYAGIISLDIDFSNSPPAYFSHKDVKQALLLVVDDERRILYSEQLGRESARLDRVFLYEDRRKQTFIVTRDYSIGMGSYNGPISYFLEVSETGIRYILPHGLMTSLKTAWIIKQTGASTEVISKKCRPDFSTATPDSLQFEVIYERFYTLNGSWQTELRSEPGFWEAEGALRHQDYKGKFARES